MNRLLAVSGGNCLAALVYKQVYTYNFRSIVDAIALILGHPHISFPRFSLHAIHTWFPNSGLGAHFPKRCFVAACETEFLDPGVPKREFGDEKINLDSNRQARILSLVLQ